KRSLLKGKSGQARYERNVYHVEGIAFTKSRNAGPDARCCRVQPYGFMKSGKIYGSFISFVDRYPSRSLQANRPSTRNVARRGKGASLNNKRSARICEIETPN